MRDGELEVVDLLLQGDLVLDPCGEPACFAEVAEDGLELDPVADLEVSASFFRSRTRDQRSMSSLAHDGDLLHVALLFLFEASESNQGVSKSVLGGQCFDVGEQISDELRPVVRPVVALRPQRDTA